MKTVMKQLLLTIVWLLCFLSEVHIAQAQDLSKLLTGNETNGSAPAPDKVITVTHLKQNDKKIEKRLQEIFSELDNLKNIKVSVSNGVVTLEGEIVSKAAETRAIQFAQQIESVVEVESRLIFDQSITKRFPETINKILTFGKQLIAGLPLILMALLIFLIFWTLGGWLSQRRSLFRRISVNNFIAELLGKITHFVFILIGIVLALNLLDSVALLSTILGAAGIFGLAVGFAIRDTVENFIASTLLSIRNPFEINDFIDIEGQQGNVARLTSRATILISPDGNHIRIPNSTVYKATITNFTRNPERRFQFDIGVGTTDDLSRAQAVALAMLKTIPGILKEPKPLAIIHELGDSNVVMRIFGWVNQTQHDFLKVRSEAIKSVKQVFDESLITMPNPIYDLRMTHDQEPSPEKNQQSVKKALKINLQNIDNQAEEVHDMTIDRTVENQISKENIEDKGENLLDPNTPSEL
ncbi:mechanosensitive ion channel domain-containing protein [Methylotuvimicrobium sp.]|uniref:mechanosensitive ion channel domain-containing protein n=1 Tax=Methylotuvimicrobium sp. TaxID=2822413 RepID=UPI003D654BD2